MPMAPSTQKAPCARFTTFVTRKTSEKPRAAIAKTPPCSRPPMTIWRIVDTIATECLCLQRNTRRLTDDKPGVSVCTPATHQRIVDGQPALRDGLEIVDPVYAGQIGLAADVLLDLTRRFLCSKLP